MALITGNMYARLQFPALVSSSTHTLAEAKTFLSFMAYSRSGVNTIMKKLIWVRFALTALCLCMFVATGHAATLASGNLFFTTFQNQGGTVLPLTTNVWQVGFIYDSVTGISYSAVHPLQTLSGADGIIFNPNNGDLLIGEQVANKVGQIPTTGVPVAEVAASSGGAGPQAFNLVVSPDKSTLLAMPNQPGSLGGNVIDLLPLTPSLGAGTAHTVVGPDISLTGVAFLGGKAYYGDASDFTINGHLGILDLTTFTTTRITVVGETQGALPSHALITDPFTNDLIISGANQIWQLSLDATGTVATVVAKISVDKLGVSNWDQTSVDGAGHLFAANNDGNILFIDYSAGAHLISAPVYTKEQFLAADLDDLANGGGTLQTPVDGRMTGGGSVFEIDGTRVTHGFELHCDTTDVPNTLEINWASHRFHLTTLTSGLCFQDPSINAGHPTNIFNTYVGIGTGLLDGATGATAFWTFTDAGEPGTNDTATITIKDSLGNDVLTVSGKLDSGNQQAHTDNK